MAKVTDQLLRIANSAWLAEHDAVERELLLLKQKHFDAVDQAVHNSEMRAILYGELEAAFSSLERTLTTGRQFVAAGEESISRRSFTNSIAAWGERLCGAVGDCIDCRSWH